MIDCHTHLTNVWPDCDSTGYWRKHHRIPDCLLEPYLQAMESVDRAIVLAWPYPAHSACGNEAAAQLVREYGDKFLLFWAVNPRLPTALSDLERGVQECGAVGVKMSSLYMKFKPDDTRHFPVYERIQELGLPIMWHQGSSFEAGDGPLEWAQPWRLDKVARTFPGLKIIISHLGFPWVREVIALLRKRANVYTDISSLAARTWILYDGLVNAVQYGAADKILFGSDYPLVTPVRMREALYEAAAIPKGTNLPPVPEDVVDGILRRNCLEILGIG